MRTYLKLKDKTGWLCTAFETKTQRVKCKYVYHFLTVDFDDDFVAFKYINYCLFLSDL